MKKEQTKNKHAQALGRLGGKNSRKYMTKERARTIAINAVKAREAKKLDKIKQSSEVDKIDIEK